MKKINHIIVILILLIFSQQASSQSLIRTNPADIVDPQALFINPAILPYQNLAFNLGMKIYHVGFLSDNSTGLKYSYNSNSFPNILLNGVGVGITLQSFDTPYLNNTGIGISLGYSIIPNLSIGISAQGSNLHYDPSKFDLVNPFDPVFQNGTGQWNISFGAGLLVRPNEKLSVGLSCNHINRPDLSLMNDGSRIPFELDSGIKYYLNRIFGVSVFAHYQEEELTPGILAEANIDNKGLVKTGYIDRCLVFEGHINLINGFGLNYRLDYPLYEVNEFSNGSHQLGITWNMKYNPDYSFNIQASKDTIKVIKEYTRIKISKRENRKQIFSNLDYQDLKFPEKRATEEISTISSGMSLDDIAEALPHTNHLEAYRDNFLGIQESIKLNNKDIVIHIYFPDATTAERARVIKNYLVDSLKFNEDAIKLLRESNDFKDFELQKSKKDSIENSIENSDDQFTDSEYIEISSPPIERLVPEKLFFHIHNVKLRRVNKWRILITNYLKEPVHEIIGYHNIENLVEWDCFKNDGTLMQVGNYYYQFQYSTGGNRWIPKNPNRHRLVFARVNRAKEIEITTNTINNLEMLRAIIIRLKEPSDYKNLEN